ncbi:MAG TPA: hypothetical protein VGJ78_01530 [Vicinamibacterales bacterium]
MIPRSFLAALAAFALLPAPPPLLAQASEWFGTWTLNLQKSVYTPGPAPYERATMKVEPLDAGRVRFAYDFVYPRGGVQHLEWDGRFDGRDYIVQGADEYITYAYRETGGRTYEIVAKLDLRVSAVANVTIAPGGRALTTITRSRSGRGQEIVSTTVYDKID